LISRKFIKSSLIYTIAGALPLASALILLPFYVAYLPTEVYGVLSLSLAFSVFVQILVSYSFDTSLYIHYHEYKGDPARLNQLVSSIFIFMMAIAAAVCLFFTLTGELIFDLIFDGTSLAFYPYGLMSVVIGACQAMFKVHSNLLQTSEKPQTFFWANVASFALIALTTIVGLKLYPGTLIGPLGGRLLAGLLSVAWVLIRVFMTHGVHMKSPWLLTSSRFNAYTFVYQIQQWAGNYIDRFLMLFFLPLSSVGVYNFAIQCVLPIELLLNGLNASINPRIVSIITSQQRKGSTPELNRYYYGLVSSILLLVCATLLAVPLVLDFFVNKSDYAPSIPLIPFLAAIYIFKSMRLYFVSPLTTLKKMRELMTLNLLVTLFRIAAMVLMMYYWQLMGLIISAYLAYALEMILLHSRLGQYFDLRFNAFKLLIGPCAMFVCVVMGEYFFEDVMMHIRHAIYLSLCVVLLLFAYRNEIRLIKLNKIVK